MILVDTSVWIDHLRVGDEDLAALLDDGEVMTHPFVIGELALGHLRQRETVLALLNDLPQATVATDREVMHFVNQYRLFGLGIGYIDAHLLAAVQLTAEAALWTRDRRLSGAAGRLALAVRSPH